jgi:ABC-2 type transport system permease protein
MSRDLAGTGQLIRLILRRDRIRLPLWVLGFTVLTGATVPAVTELYRTPAQIAAYGETVAGSAAGRFMQGRPYDVDNLGGIVAYELTATLQWVIALMVIFLVIRHTRAEEESGRAELLRSTVLGRHAHTASAVIVAIAASVLLGVIDALLLIGGGLDATGSLLHGGALAALGLVFTAIAAAAAQVTASARAALGLAGGAFGVLVVLRGIGGVNETFWTWLSPFGWGQAVEPYGDPRWWPVAALIGLAAAAFSLTAFLTANRDEGAGLLPDRPGRARARDGLATTFGLALRQQRGLIIGWSTGLALTAVSFGSFGREVEDLVASNEQMAEIFAAQGQDVLEGYFAYTLAFLAVVTSAFALASALRLRAEENAGRADLVLATRVSRLRWAAGWLAVTVVATLFSLALTGFAMGGTHALMTGDGGLVGTATWAMLAQGPAVFLVAGVGVLLYGALPRWALVAWAVFAFAMVQSYLGGLLEFPGPVAGLSPFDHLAEIPVESFRLWPVLVLAALVVGGTGLGLWRFRTRDLASA